MNPTIGLKDPCPFMKSHGCFEDCEELVTYRKIIQFSPTGYISGCGHCKQVISVKDDTAVDKAPETKRSGV